MRATKPLAQAPIERVSVAAYCVPTERPESDGTLEWRSTTLVVVEVAAAGARGLGYSYADRATATLIGDRLAACVEGLDAMSPPLGAAAMLHAVRNLGRRGVAQMAISAVEAALWDLKARLLGLPLATLWGVVREEVPLYGSGGFTSYTTRELEEQLGGWVDQGIPRVKMKVGREPAEDPARVSAARAAIGPAVELMVDANGAYTRKQALGMAERFAEAEVSWFEEPVPSDDLEGLRLLRDRGPAGMAVAAGEYGYDPGYFDRMLAAGAVDVLQADATRCGVSGFLAAGALCAARDVRLSAHCAPALHVHLGCAVERLVHLEYFHDHVRIERLLFDGAPVPRGGSLAPDLSRPGLGLELKRADAARFTVEET
jgi:L-alanine-DL-glutamate epimerase-like enolase superfamily enzyme